MEKLRITVITVCYNCAATIRDTLKSIASQSYNNFEHIIVDGASTDDTLSIIRGWTKHSIRIVSEPDNGIYDAMNKGMRLATGEVIGFLNADDFYADSSVLGQIASAFQDSTLDACYADLVYVSQDNRRIIRYWRSKIFRKGDFALGWCPAHPTFYVRKLTIERLGYFDQSFGIAADAEMMMRYLENGEINFCYIPAVWVRMRVGGTTNQSLKNIIRQNGEIFRALKKNNIAASRFLFVSNKIINRIGQLFCGLARR